MSPFERVLAALRSCGCNPRMTGSGRNGTALCPSHDDQQPSLSFNESAQGLPLLYCHAGCSFEAIIRDLGLNAADLRSGQSPGLHAMRDRNPRAVANRRYAIRNALGDVQAIHIRSDFSDGSKRFSWEGPEGCHGLGGRAVASLPLYGTEVLPGLLKQATVIVTEGEKACDALTASGFNAVATVTGAHGTPEPDVLSVLLPFDVILWPDSDEPGQQHMSNCARVLRDLGAELRTLTWPDAGKGEDAADYFERGGTREQLDALIEAATGSDLSSANRTGAPVLIRLSDVNPQAIEWLWKPYLPIGKLTLLDGDPGAGKTFLSLAIAATLTTGGQFPGEHGTVERTPVPVLYIGAEDGIEDTIRPRCDSLGADSRLITVLAGRRGEDGQPVPIDLKDIGAIEEALNDTKARLVVLDPIQAFLGADVDAHRANETRPLLAALGRLAVSKRCAVLAIRHLRKSGGGSALHAGLGSIDFTAAARSLLTAGQDPNRDDVRVLAHAKCSGAARGPSLAYKLTEGRFHWIGRSELTADDICRAAYAPKNRKRREAADFLAGLLTNGPLPVKEIEQRAKAAGHSWSTVERAAKDIDVIKYRTGGIAGDGHWVWSLGDDDEAVADAKDS